MIRRVLLAAAALSLAPTATAAASDAWVVTGRTTLPLQYWQGVAYDAAGTSWYSGPVVGLYRDNPAGHEVARVSTGIVPGEPFNHIGDLEYDTHEGGRLLLPLECYDPSKSPANYCGFGDVGVADPITFARRYTVRLNGVPKTMWLALGPDGRLWTQAGRDLLAFSADAISAGGPAAIDPIATLHNVFDGEADGAAVLGHRLYFTRQGAPGVQQLWSLDLTSGTRRLEATVPVVGESEGIAAYRGLGGRLHWVIAFGAAADATFGTQSVLLHLNPRGAKVPGKRQHLARLRLKVTHGKLRPRRKATLKLRASATVVGIRQVAAGATARAAGKHATLDSNGRAKLRVRVPAHGRLKVTVRQRGFRNGTVRLKVSPR